MNLIKKLRDDYVIWHADRVQIPKFTQSVVVRKKVVFSGKVQKVGFRLELFRIAQRMKLTGWVKNLYDGSVEAQLQGEELQIDFLIHCMQSLKRAKVQHIKTTILPIVEREDNFTIRD